jgi:tRNA A37 threonylcarbamoyladenosine modification protein TsaB
MREVYWGCFERGVNRLATAVGDEHVGKPASVTLPEAWGTELGEAGGKARGEGSGQGGAVGIHGSVVVPGAPGTYGVGRGFAAYPELRSALAGGLAGFYERLLPRASEIAVLAAPEVQSGRLIAPETAVPIYLRDDVAHVPQPKSLD